MTGQDIMDNRFLQRCAPFVLLLACLESRLAHGKTIDKSPRPTALLAESKQFLAQDAWNSVALYGFQSTNPIRRFPANARINEMEATADERFLLVACANGEIGVWNIGTGHKMWWHTSSQSGLGYIYDASFSWDGRTLVACNGSDFAVVFNALTGKQIGKISFPPMQTNIMSVTLAPDGSSGALVDLGQQLFTFDVRTGLMKDTGLKGGWPVRFSANGKYIALRNSNSGTEEQLRVVDTNHIAKKDVGQLSLIGHIKPTSDGGFLACARVGTGFNEHDVTVGVAYDSASGELKEVWKLPVRSADYRTDFDPKRLIGVSTNCFLVTRLIDLRTGEPRLTIDNSANYRENILTSSGDFESSWLLVIGGISALAVAAWVITHVLRHKRKMSPST